MWFSAGVSGVSGVDNGTHCLVVATTPNINTQPFQYYSYFCFQPAGAADGDLDPDIYITSGGQFYLLFSVERAYSSADNTIYSAQLSADGRYVVGSIYDVANGSDIPGRGGAGPSYGVPGGTGNYPPASSAPVIENPELFVEPHPYVDSYGNSVFYDLYASYGLYNQSQSYHTLKMPCSSPTVCDEGDSVEVDPLMLGIGAASGGDNNPGGASFVQGPSSPTQYLVFHTGVGPRPESWESEPSWGDPRLDGMQVLSNGQSLYPSNNDGYSLRMQNDGNLVLYNQANQPRWSSGTPMHDTLAFAIVLADGKIVIYDDGNPIWANSVAGYPGAYLVLQNGNNIVEYASNGQTVLFAAGP